MRRQRWFEIHDQPWFPRFLRDLTTEALEGMWASNRTYHPIAGRLRDALERAGADRVVDLCSGGGGPWLVLYDEVAAGREIEVCLTDFYPNERMMLRAMGHNSEIAARTEPVDARCVPAELPGFRTIFSALHHFDPEAARAMLADAFERREGIAVFEAARPHVWTILAVTAVPFLGFRNALAARPVRWNRIFWSCVIPVIPAILWIDGVLSCLRSYSLEDLRELVAGLSAADYSWTWGDQGGGPVAIRYLIGVPVKERVAGSR
ncbi:MAG TPA: class I SAM-dependent methyltransferase [Acidobacteriaceae bacterium]|jgi:hypothetical protein|nr:class I SAM-dependent methyltransferase [Acidobacteriaceae bacterium]